MAPPRWFDFFTQPLHIEPSPSVYKCGPGTVDTFDILACRYTVTKILSPWSFKVPCIGMRLHPLHTENIAVIFLLSFKDRQITNKNIETIKYNVGCQL